MSDFTDQEKRWLVTGATMYKILAPGLRQVVKEGLEKFYTQQNSAHHLQTLTFEQASSAPIFKNWKFLNINDNAKHGKDKKLYNHSIRSATDLAKVYLPDYLTSFSEFDESLELSAILRLLAVTNPPIFTAKPPSGSIQVIVEDMRKEVKNIWGNCVMKDWSKSFFEQCFVKMEAVTKCVGLPKPKRNELLEKLQEWKKKGNKLCTPGEVSELKTIQFVEHQLIFFDTQKDGVLEQELPVAHAKLKALEQKVKAAKDNQVKTEEREKSKELRRRQSSCFKLNLDNVTT